MTNVPIRDSDEYSEYPGKKMSENLKDEQSSLTKEGEGTPSKVEDEGGKDQDYNNLHILKAKPPHGDEISASLKEKITIIKTIMKKITTKKYYQLRQ